MQTNIKTKLLISLFVGTLCAQFLAVPNALAATSSGDLSTFTLREDPTSANHETRFTLTLTPEPTDQVTTTYTTNGQCSVGYNFVDYTSGGAVVTQNGSLPMGIRAIDDADGEGAHKCEVTFTSRSDVDPQYASPVVLQYSINIIDDDATKEYAYDITTLTSARLKEGDTFVEQYQVSLSQPPTYNVTIRATANEQCDMLVGLPQKRAKSATQTIKKGTTIPATFTIIPVQDSEFEGIHKCTVSHAASTQDANYLKLTIPAHSATIVDDDVNPNIPDEREYEGGLIYYRDANFDGVDDDEQSAVTSFINKKVDARQALIVVDENGVLREDCQFRGAARAGEYADAPLSLETTQGLISFSISCENDDSFSVIWLLDSYQRDADSWVMYDASQDGTLNTLDFDAIIYNLGDEFTTGISIPMDEDGDFSIFQTEPQFRAEAEGFDDSLVANVHNSRLNPLAIASLAIGAATIIWLIYRKYFARVDTTNSRYPRVDRF